MKKLNRNKAVKIDIKKIFFLSIVLALSFTTEALSQSKIPGEVVLHQKTQVKLQSIIEQSEAITGLVAIDLTTGKTSFSFRPDFSFPQASAIKVPLLMALVKQVQNGELSFSEEHSIQESDIIGGSGILKRMEMPVTLSVYNICILMIAESDNSATNFLIDLVGMENVNETMQALGMEKTLLQRKMMDVKASARGDENLSTPAEAAHILQMLYNGKYINKQASSKVISFMKETPRNASSLAAGIPNNVPIAFKPGGIRGVVTEWALVLLEERPYAVALMESYSNPGNKGQNIEALSETLYRYFWKLGNSTRYGVYRNPAFIKK